MLIEGWGKSREGQNNRGILSFHEIETRMSLVLFRGRWVYGSVRIADKQTQNRGGKTLNTIQVIIISPLQANYNDFFVNLQLIRGNSIQDIRKEEALCLSCT